MIRHSIADRTGYSFEGGGPDGNLFTFAELTVAMVRENSADPQTVMQALADTLIAAHKINPGMLCVGVDLDSRCAKMTALNFLFRAIKGDVDCGNTLTNEMQTVWKVRGTWVTEHDVPPTPIEPEMPTHPGAAHYAGVQREWGNCTVRKNGRRCMCRTDTPRPLNRYIGRLNKWR